MTCRRPRHGFSFIELLIVVAVLGILAAVVVPKFTNANEKARVAALATNLGTLRDAYLRAYDRDGEWPATPSVNTKPDALDEYLSDAQWANIVESLGHGGTLQSSAFGNVIVAYTDVPNSIFIEVDAALDDGSGIGRLGYNGVGVTGTNIIWTPLGG